MFTISVNPGISVGIPSVSAVKPSVPRAIPPVHSTHFTTGASNPRKMPQISTAKITCGSSGSLTPVGGGLTPSKRVITPIAGSTPTHIPQTHTHSTSQSSRNTSFTRGMDLEVAKFDLNDDPQGSTQTPLLDPEPDFRHPSFRAPQQTIAKPVNVRDLRGDPFLVPEGENPLEEAMV